MELKKEGQRFKGHIGTWYLIDSAYVQGQKWFMYESEIYGDEAAHIVINRRGDVMFESFDPLVFTVNEYLDD